MKARILIAWLQDYEDEREKRKLADDGLPSCDILAQLLSDGWECVNVFEANEPTVEGCEAVIYYRLFRENWTEGDSFSLWQEWDEQKQEWK